jgi:GT2 family glycosyltransferase
MSNLFGMVTTAGSREYTALALRSFFACTPLAPGDRVAVVDTGGGFGLPSGLPTHRVAVLAPGEPCSFARAANLLLDLARSRQDDLVLVHDDVVFTPGWLAPLLGEQPTLVASCTNAQFPYRRGALALRPAMTLQELDGRERELIEIAGEHAGQQHGRRSVPAPPPACVRIPSSAQDLIGAFDERVGAAGIAERDYALRAWTAGVPVELALESFVLHFQADSSGQGGAETRPPLTEAFAQKWGSALAYAYLADDWNLFLSDPALSAAVASGRYDDAIERLRRQPALDPFIARQQRATFAAVCVVYEDDSWLPQTVESVYDLCDSIWFFVNDRPWFGEPTDQQPMIARLRSLPDPAGKFRLVEGHWADEIEPRNEALARLADAGIDYCFVLDADEIWDPVVLATAMNAARQNPQIGLWRAGCYTYWKSARYRVEPPEPYRAVVFLRVGAGRFTYSRDGVARSQAAFPIEEVAFHHMSYARSDEVIRRKIATCTHKFDVVPGWFDNVWSKWDKDRSLRNVHPCWPDAYRGIVEQPVEALPPVLRHAALDDDGRR